MSTENTFHIMHVVDVHGVCSKKKNVWGSVPSFAPRSACSLYKRLRTISYVSYACHNVAVAKRQGGRVGGVVWCHAGAAGKHAFVLLFALRPWTDQMPPRMLHLTELLILSDSGAEIGNILVENKMQLLATNSTY